MKTLRRLIYGEILTGVLAVTLGFVALFFFFDVVEELQSVGKLGALGYKIPQALLYVSLSIPSHVYELLPITVLIGTIFVMARLARSSEFTILRTSGLGPWRAMRTLLLIGLGFVILTFVTGDYIAPFAEKSAQLLKARFQGQITVGKTGAWLKERQTYGHYAINVGSLSPDASMSGIRIFEFDNQGALVSMTQARRGVFASDDAWELQDLERTEFVTDANHPNRVDRQTMASLRWPTTVTAEMVASAVLRPEKMSAVDLFEYIHHLDANGQSAQKYETQFWRKVFYPLSCLVMVVLALPFAYLHFRSGTIATYVFGGVMAGISFVLLNNVLGDLGNLKGWAPWITAALPSLIYSFFSLLAFSWLVLRR